MRSGRSWSRWRRLVAVLLWGCAAGAGAQAGSAATKSDPHVIRVWGYKAFEPQLLRWEAAYAVAHPEMRFENVLHGPAAVMAGLVNGVADVVLMGREIWPVETMAYHWVYQQQPFGVMVATAGLQAPGQSFTPVVVVNAKNPVEAITLAQLDAIYGSEHRAAPANIRTWGEMGAAGAWAGKPVDAYGFGAEDALGVYFRHDVLLADFKPNPASHLLSDRDGNAVPAAERIATAVAADADAIGYTRQPRGAATKVLAVGGVMPSEATLATHAYPLTRSIAMYFYREPGKAMAAKVEPFVRFVLSAEGQAMVRAEEGLLPLTAVLAAKQEQKLDRPMPRGVVVEDKE